MSVAQYSCLPRRAGAHWVALSDAAAAIVRSLPPPAPRTAKGAKAVNPQRTIRDGRLLRRPCGRRIQRATNQVNEGFA